MLTVFWDMKGSITIDFLEKDANNASNCQLFRQNSPYLLNNPHRIATKQTRGSLIGEKFKDLLTSIDEGNKRNKKLHNLQVEE